MVLTCPLCKDKNISESDIDDLFYCNKCNLLFFDLDIQTNTSNNIDVGDWIEFINTDHPLFGSIGKIIERDKDFAFFRIELDIGELWVPYYWIKKRGDLNVKPE